MDLKLRCQSCLLVMPCGSSEQPGRRDHGGDFPWGVFCLNAIGAASALVIGFYALIAPCAPWPVTLVISLLHVAGVSAYTLLLRFDVRSRPQTHSFSQILHHTYATPCPGRSWTSTRRTGQVHLRRACDGAATASATSPLDPGRSTAMSAASACRASITTASTCSRASARPTIAPSSRC